jgi:hypothetical protein
MMRSPPWAKKERDASMTKTLFGVQARLFSGKKP